MSNYDSWLVLVFYIKMRMKKFTSLIVFILFFGAVSLWASISISPESGNFGKNCVLEFDIIVDTSTEKILWTDIYIKSTMEYVDFVPSTIFDYYLPPKVENKNIYLWAFSEQGKEFVWKSKFGTLYLKSNDIDPDWYINFDFVGEGKTSDTNLSIIWWEDKLVEVKNWIYYFDGEPCEHSAIDADIEWSFSSIDEDEYIKDMISWFKKKALIQKITLLFSKYWWTLLVFFLLLVSIYVFIKNKKSKINERD